jgi:hypothetical protein
MSSSARGDSTAEMPCDGLVSHPKGGKDANHVRPGVVVGVRSAPGRCGSGGGGVWSPLKSIEDRSMG